MKTSKRLRVVTPLPSLREAMMPKPQTDEPNANTKGDSKMENTNDNLDEDGRNNMIVLEAIAFAIEGMSRLPNVYRPDSNIDDLKELLGRGCNQRERDLFQRQARRRVDILLLKIPTDSLPANTDEVVA
jgi:hypothetical protein